jgi:BolA protein
VSADTVARIRERLAVLCPDRLEIEDDSARHAGHAGAREGGHYNLLIVAGAFAGKSTMARHRLVFETLDDLMRSGIHALSIKAKAPEEV